MVDWAAAYDLCLLNIGMEPTCVRPQGQSTIDLTWASPAIFPYVEFWRVLNEVSLSDHKYICIQLRHGPLIQSGLPAPLFKQWSIHSLDKDLLRALIIFRQWTVPWKSMSPESMAQFIQATFIGASNLAMSIRTTRKRRNMYWWSTEIAQLRRAYNVARRKVTRARKRQYPDLFEINQTFVATRRQLRRAMKGAKDASWRELISSIDGDP